MFTHLKISLVPTIVLVGVSDVNILKVITPSPKSLPFSTHMIVVVVRQEGKFEGGD